MHGNPEPPSVTAPTLPGLWADDASLLAVLPRTHLSTTDLTHPFGSAPGSHCWFRVSRGLEELIRYQEEWMAGLSLFCGGSAETHA